MAYFQKRYIIESDDESDHEDENLDDVKFCSNDIINKPKSIISKTCEIIDIAELNNLYNSILKQYWKYDKLKPTQFDIIRKVLVDKSDVCAVLATGFGKSICYQLQMLISNKSVIVVSPLIALMHEQGLEMKNKKIPVAIFNSQTSSTDKENEKKAILNGEPKLIYMTPEYLIKSEAFIKELEPNLASITIDEAHAVSIWGLDFRTSYTKLGICREWVPSVPILTLTATASTKVREDINKILKLVNPQLIIGDFDRPNLLIGIQSKIGNSMSSIASLLAKYKNEYVIIYCNSRNNTDLLAENITNIGVKCSAYHAGMSDINRANVQQSFIDGDIKCITATIAFGMGINIPNVRLVIHYNCPKNIESYYQEIGRAGRDGLPAECVLFYSPKDFQTNRYFLKSLENSANKTYQENQTKQIEKLVYSNECRRKLILENFGQKMLSCNNCDNCLNKLNLNLPKIVHIDYTHATYLLLNVITKLSGKFGQSMMINVLLGKKSKIKPFMEAYSEYGLGITFGNDDWWKLLIRYIINDDIIQETQIKGSFGSTISLSEKGIEIRNKLIQKYQTINDLKFDIQSKNYNPFIEYQEIIIEKKISTKLPKKITKEPTSIKISKIVTKKIQNTEPIDINAKILDDEFESMMYGSKK